MGTSEINLTETFENDLLDVFLAEMSNYPSKIFDDEGSPLYTNYEALEVLQLLMHMVEADIRKLLEHYLIQIQWKN